MSKRSLLNLAALATAAIPGLNVVALRPPQSLEGDYHYTGVLDDQSKRWVIVAPATPAAGASLESEITILRHLANYRDAHRIAFEVPRPQGFATLPEGGRAMVYRDLAGDNLSIGDLDEQSNLATSLGRTLAALHEIPANLVEHTGLPVYNATECRDRRLAQIDEAAATGKVPPALLQRWEEALEDIAWWRFRTVTVHGDLNEDQIRVAHEQVLGLQGFSRVHVGDPAEDFSWLVAEASEEVLDKVFEAYHLARAEGSDMYLRHRAELYGELALVEWLLHGLHQNDEDIVNDAQNLFIQLYEQVGDTSLNGGLLPDRDEAEDLDAGLADHRLATSQLEDQGLASRAAATSRPSTASQSAGEFADPDATQEVPLQEA